MYFKYKLLSYFQQLDGVYSYIVQKRTRGHKANTKTSYFFVSNSKHVNTTFKNFWEDILGGIFKVSRVHPGSLCSEQQSSTAKESLAGSRGREASIEFQGQFFDILKGVQQIHICLDM